MLAALEVFLAPADTLVTFNGKSFDLPLLVGRYIRNGSRLSWTPSGHIDLLHLARRLWRDRLPSRALGQLETHILGVSRTEEEVPGWLVPQMYIDYLQTGDARPLRGVFYHNAMDILSLVTLLNYAATLLEEPLTNNGPEDGIQLVAIGRLCEDLGRTDQAIALYQHGIEQELPLDIYQNAVKRLSMVWKRGGNFREATALWEKAAENEEVYAFVELAKFYEHRAKNLEEAAGWTQSALELVSGVEFPVIERYQWQPELEHRMQRLNRRMGL
jgi:tetratricopeptide (TPR) repeat protein